MDVRQLTVFVAVVRHGGFTRAAAQLHQVQSAVSTTIATLERDVGQQLFVRRGRSVTLTPAGEALHDHAVRILDDVRAAQDAVDRVEGGLSGPVSIGYMTNVTLFDIPRLLGGFHAEHPGVTLHLAPSSTGTTGLVDQLRSGDIDVAFLSVAAREHADLHIDELASSPLGLTVPAGHEAAGRADVRLADTLGLPFVDFRRGFASRALVDAELRRRGLSRTVGIESADLNDLVALVRNGLGVAFLPRYLVEPDDRLRWIPVTDATLTMYVSVATARARTLSAAAAQLAAMARAAAP